jgi:hypothetical protein
MKTRTWVALIVALLALFGALALWLSGRSAAGRVANIYVDGVCVRSVDLSKLKEGETYTVETEGGQNVIQIEPGRVCVQSADCPDQVCVQAGWLTDSAAPIVCLHHRLVIRLEESGSAEDVTIDGVSK